MGFMAFMVMFVMPRMPKPDKQQMQEMMGTQNKWSHNLISQWWCCILVICFSYFCSSSNECPFTLSTLSSRNSLSPSVDFHSVTLGRYSFSSFAKSSSNCSFGFSYPGRVTKPPTLSRSSGFCLSIPRLAFSISIRGSSPRSISCLIASPISSFSISTL